MTEMTSGIALPVDRRGSLARSVTALAGPTL